MSVVLTKIRNPFEPGLAITELVEYVPGKSLLYYVSDLPFGTHDLKFVIALNGIIQEYAGPEELTAIVEDDDRVTITAKTGVTASAAIASMIASYAFPAGLMGITSTAMGYAAVYGVTFLASMFAVGYGMSKVIAALSPDIPKSTSAEDVYGWGQLAQTNQQGLSIPYLYGACRVSGNVINQFTTIDEYDNETLHVLMGICDHEIDSITDIRINDQAYTFYEDVDVYTRLGSNDNAVIPGFNEIVDQTDVGSKLAYGVVTTKSTSDCEKINIRVSAPGGIYYMDTDGKPSTLFAAASVKYKPHADSTYQLHSVLVCGPSSKIQSGVDTSGFSGDQIEAKNEFGMKYVFASAMSESAKQQFITDNLDFFGSTDSADMGSTESKVYEITIDDLTLDRYDFQIERINEDWDGLKESADIYLQSYQEVLKQGLIYPGLAMYAVTALATDQLSNSMPAFSCLGTNTHVSVYNPDTSLWEDKPANNPAWVIYDLIVNKAGRPTDSVIYDDFSDFATHITSLGIETGIYITGVNNSNYWAEIQRIASIGRGAVVQRGTKYGIFIDNAFVGTVPHIFNSANTIEGSLKIEWLAKTDIANAVEIEYTDPDRDHTRQVVTVISEDYLTDDDVSAKATVQIEAAISQSAVTDYGVFLINCNKHLSKSITFDAFVDSFGCTVGDLFYYQQEIPNSNDCHTGRIVDAGADDGDGHPYVTLDKAVTLGTGTAYLIVRLPDGSFVEKTVLGVSSKPNSFALTTAWATTPAQFDIYSIGTQTAIKKTYRLTSITRQDDFVRTITGLEYIDDIYTDRSGTIIEEPTWNRITQEALNVHLSEVLAYSSDGSYKSVINAAWGSSLGNYDQTGWDVWLKNMNNGNVSLIVADLKKHNYTIDKPLAVGTTFKVLVVPSSQGMNDTGDNTATIIIQGKLAPPSDVTGFTGTWDAMKRQVQFSWAAIDDVDLWFYEIRQGESFNDGTKIAEAVGTSKSIYIDEGVSDSITYWIAAKDDSGIYSTSPASTTVEIDTSDCGLAVPTGLTLSTSSAISPDGTDTVSLNATWDNNAEISDDWRNYEIWLEEISIGKFSEFATQKTEYRWDVKPNTEYGVAVRSVDRSGNVTDFCAQETITTAKDADPPDAPTWPASLDIIPGFKLIGLNWNDSTASDLAHYIFERSETGAFAGEQFESGGIDASYTTDTQLAVDTLYYYRVKAVDTSGNESGWSAVKSATTLQVGSSDIAYNAIIANHIMVSNLAAISANIGTITAGKLQNAAGTSYLDLDNDLMALGDKLTYNGTELSINAEVTFKSGSSGYDNLSDKPSSLADINPAEYGILDNSISTWFYDYVPTLSNVPASDWTTNDDKNLHLGDLFYDGSTGYSYRFKYQSSTYSWVKLSDSDVTAALANAAAAQDTADGKRRVFLPDWDMTTEYDSGDLWDTGNGIKRSSEDRAAGAYVAGDWVLVGDVTADSTVGLQALANSINLLGQDAYEEQYGTTTWTYSYLGGAGTPIENLGLSVGDVVSVSGWIRAESIGDDKKLVLAFKRADTSNCGTYGSDVVSSTTYTYVFTENITIPTDAAKILVYALDVDGNLSAGGQYSKEVMLVKGAHAVQYNHPPDYYAYVRASNVQAIADAAVASIGAMEADSILSVAEKTTWRSEWLTMTANYNLITARADALSVSQTSFAAARTALYNYLVAAGVWSDQLSSYTITGTALSDKVVDYYEEMQALVDACSDKKTEGWSAEGATVGAAWGTNITNQPQSSGNLVNKSTFEDGVIGLWYGSVGYATSQAWTRCIDCTARATYESNWFPVLPGEVLHLGADITAWDADYAVSFGLHLKKADGTNKWESIESISAGTSWTRTVGTITVDAGYITARPYILINGEAGTDLGTAKATNFYISRNAMGATRNTGTLADQDDVDFVTQVTGFGGTGVNVMPPRYCVFSEPELPPYSSSQAIVTLSTTQGKFGGTSLKLAPSGASSYVNLKSNSIDANMVIEPGQKWIVSFWALSSTIGSSERCRFFILTWDGSSYSYYGIGHYFASANTWEKVSGVLDLSGDNNAESFARIYNDGGIGCHMYFDGFMVEKQVGTGTTPSAFSLPAAKTGNDLTGWGSDDDESLIDGGKIYVGSSLQIGNADGTSDYCYMNAGEIDYYRYIGGAHKYARSLKSIEVGSATSGTTVTLEGFYRSAPAIIASPKTIKTYSVDGTNESYDQEISVNITNLSETSTDSCQYSFVPVCTLNISGQVSSGTPETTGYDSSTSTNPLTVTTANYTSFDSGVRSVTAFISARGYIDNWIEPDSAPPGYRISRAIFKVRVQYYYNGAWAYSSWSDTVSNTSNYRSFSITVSNSSYDITQMKIELNVSTLESFDHIYGDVIFQSYTAEMTGYSTSIANGIINYIAIGE